MASARPPARLPGSLSAPQAKRGHFPMESPRASEMSHFLGLWPHREKLGDVQGRREVNDNPSCQTGTVPGVEGSGRRSRTLWPSRGDKHQRTWKGQADTGKKAGKASHLWGQRTWPVDTRPTTRWAKSAKTPCVPSKDTDVVPGQRGQHRKQDSLPGAPTGDRAADWESRHAVGQPHSPTAAHNCPQGH